MSDIRLGGRKRNLSPEVQAIMDEMLALDAARYGINTMPPEKPVHSTVRPVTPYVPPQALQDQTTFPPVQPSMPAPISVMSPNLPPKRQIANIDMSKVPAYPAYPTAPVYEQAPQIDQGQLARQQGRAALRAGLIGLLLGGGAGGLMAATGAAQGVQQGTMDEYQRRLQDINARNQLSTQRYQAQTGQYGADLSQRQSILSEADAARARQQNIYDAAYELQVAEFNQREAERKRLEGLPGQRADYLRAVTGLSPADQAAAMSYIQTGQFPSTGVSKAVSAMTPAQAGTYVARELKDFAAGLRGSDWSSFRSALSQSLLTNSDPGVRAMVAALPNEAPRQTIAERRVALAEERAAAVAINDEARRKNALRALELRERHLDIIEKGQNRSLALREEAQSIRGRKASGKPDRSLAIDWNRHAREAASDIDSYMKQRRDVYMQVKDGRTEPGAGQRAIEELDKLILETYENNKDYLSNPPYDPKNPGVLTRRVDPRPYPGTAAPAGGSPAVKRDLSKWNPQPVR